jgi:hypothetical protein
MKANEMLNKIKGIIGVELSESPIKLEEMVLDNGTVLVSETFEAGQAVFIKGEDDVQIALPVGEYKLEDGKLLIVETEGEIKEITEAKDEAKDEDAVEEEPEAVTEEMAEEDEEKDYKSMELRIKKLEDYIKNLEAKKEEKTDVDMTVAENGTIKSRTVKEEYKEEPKEELKKESKEDLKEESKEVKEELSANPIKHNPANENSKQSMLGNKGFPNTILNRIYEKLN